MKILEENNFIFMNKFEQELMNMECGDKKDFWGGWLVAVPGGWIYRATEVGCFIPKPEITNTPMLNLVEKEIGLKEIDQKLDKILENNS